MRIIIFLLCLMLMTPGWAKPKKRNINDKTPHQRKSHCPKPKFVKTNNAWNMKY